MNRKKRIETILSRNFINWKFTVIDNSAQHSGHNNFDGAQGTHFCIVIRKPFGYNDNRVSIHRKIYKLLEYDFQNGLHALEIKIAN